jgi:hypothetical protein
MIDPRPLCRFCGRRWAPAQGVDATTHYCEACSTERRAHATKAFAADGKRAFQVGGYVVRAAK